MRELDWRRAAAGVTLVCVVAAALLFGMGRGWWCSCGSPVPWSFDTWSKHNSQHLFDAYTFSHILHGVLFYGLLFLVAKKLALHWRAVIAAGLEGCWELLENTDAVIQHYRENTVSLDYYGDSIANSVSDILFCTGGFFVAAAVPVGVSFAGFAATELLLLLWIKDSLLLNIVMLVYPLEFIKTWQTG